MRYFIFTILAFTAIFSLAHSKEAAAQNAEGIAAIVNQDAISISELRARMKLIMSSSGLPDTEEVMERVKPQVLNQLIDEEIRTQEAEKLEIEVTDAEIRNGIREIAGQNNLELDQFTTLFTRQGIDIESLRDQIRAKIAWQKVVQQEIRSQVEITEREIDAMQTQLAANIGKTEYFVAEIFLPVDQGSDKQEVRALASRLIAELKKGAPFPAIAQQFSQAPGASRGGVLGWVTEGQLDPALEQVLAGMKPDTISNVIETVGGYHILYLREKRLLAEDSMPARGDIANRLGVEQLERQQRRYFLDLKSAAYIERRV